MKTKVTEDEALAESYGEMASLNASGSSEDQEIDKALIEGASLANNAAVNDSLAALKAKMADSK